VEDRILALQEKKRQLIEGALDEKASQSIGRLDTRELAFLFVSTTHIIGYHNPLLTGIAGRLTELLFSHSAASSLTTASHYRLAMAVLPVSASVFFRARNLGASTSLCYVSTLHYRPWCHSHSKLIRTLERCQTSSFHSVTTSLTSTLHLHPCTPSAAHIPSLAPQSIHFRFVQIPTLTAGLASPYCSLVAWRGIGRPEEGRW
jgi:hypothetical protein